MTGVFVFCFCVCAALFCVTRLGGPLPPQRLGEYVLTTLRLCLEIAALKKAWFPPRGFVDFPFSVSSWPSGVFFFGGVPLAMLLPSPLFLGFRWFSGGFLSLASCIFFSCI